MPQSIRMKMPLFAGLILASSQVLAQQFSDSMGFNWDLSVNATVEDGSNDTFDTAMMLYVNQSTFDGAGSPKQQGDMYVYGPCPMGDVLVTRHVLHVKSVPGLFYAETFENTSDRATRVRPSIYSDFGDSGMPRVARTDNGQMSAMLYPHGPPRSSVVFHFGDRSTNYLPTLSGSSDVYQFIFPMLELAPGERRSIGYLVAQRDAGAAETLFDDTRAIFRCISQIQRLGEFSFLNLPGMSLYDTGKIKLTPQASNDLIVTRHGDQVFGELMTSEFVLTSALGDRSYSMSQVVNVISAGENLFHVVGDDGSILAGSLNPESVEFRLSDGGTGTIRTSDIDRISIREDPGEAMNSRDGKWFQFSQPVFIFAGGDRLTGQIVDQRIPVVTTIGQFEIPTDSISSIQFQNDRTGGFPASLRMKDGQQFSALLPSAIQLRIWNGQTLELQPGNLKSVFLEDQNQFERIGSVDPERSYLDLGDDDFMYARILSNQKPLEFETVFGTRAIDPAQILQLESTPGLANQVKITLWDQSKLNGKLTSPTVLLDLFGEKVEVSTAVFRNFRNPVAEPPEAIRKQYIELIRQLNHDKFEIRDAAARKLKHDAPKIRGLLKSLLDEVDVETKARIWKLLPDSDRTPSSQEASPPSPPIDGNRFEGIELPIKQQVKLFEIP